MKAIKEGKIKVRGGNTWYRVTGKYTEKPPLVIVHGGPGYPHNYLVPLEDLADERQVVFYDQLGCGKSDRLTDRRLWTVRRYVEELTEIVRFLKLKEFHILGHSFGAALGVAFSLRHPKGLVGLILADSYLSSPVWMRDKKRLMRDLPKAVQKVIAQYEKDGVHTKMYQRAKLHFYRKFVWGYKRTPSCVAESNAGFNKELYRYMWGPEEFLVTGTLKNFDLAPKLSKIKVPTFLVCGRFDEATPEAMGSYQEQLANSEVKVFKKSAHFPHITERRAYMKALRAFLGKVELNHCALKRTVV